MPMIADQPQRPLDDEQARRGALDPARSFIVQAPAGSGKTDLLVKRFLLLLSRNNPEEILAITFTRKAAAEMRKRVLAEIRNPDEIAHRLRIQTIDAFCAALTHQMPVLAKLGAQPETIEDAFDLYLESAFATLQEFSSPAVARVLAHLDNNVGAAAHLLASMLARRDQWLRRAGNPPTRGEIEEALGFERDRLLQAARALDPRASQEFAFEVLTQKNEWKKNPEGQALSGNEPLRKALAALRTMPPATYEPAQWEALEAILALLPHAAAQLKALFAERGFADFTEIAQGAVRALGAAENPSDLLLSLDQKINHVLVDEFQDTSHSQGELLNLLTAGWQPEDGRTLFLVGDPMQSIYRFREAEVALFLRARSEGLKSVRPEPLTLTTNFRSQAGLVAWFNESFPRVLPALEDQSTGAVPYSPCTPNEPALGGDAVTWHCFYDREREAQKVVELVQAARSAQGSAAILVRNRAHLDAIVPALKAAGVRFRAVEIEQLGEKQIVQDLWALTRALSHPADRIAWLAVLRAPWCGLTLDDLLLLTDENKNSTFWELMNDDLVVCRLSEDGRKRLLRARDALWPAIRDRLRGTLRDQVEACWLSLGGPACVESATDLEDAGIFLDELERLEDAGEVDMAALEGKLEKLWALPDVEAGPGSVEIMTIHKAKGLEFDTVIVPGLDREPRAGRRQLVEWKELNVDSLLVAPLNAVGTDKEPAYEYVRRLNRDAEDIEAGRLFYVAATRAESRLHLLACAKPDDDSAPKQPAPRSLLAKIWWQARPHFGPATAAAEPAVPPIPNTIRRLPLDYQLPAAPPPAPWTPPAEGREEEEIEFSWAGETARHVGVVVHRWLQRIAEDELKGWTPARVESLRPHFLADLKRRGVQHPAPAAELVVTAVRNSIADERGRWILGSHPEAKSEYRLRTAARSFIIDRLLRDRDGRRWIVDFKTSRHEGGDLGGFLDEQQQRYAAQLDAYAAALGGARKGIYLPLHSGWRDWE